MGSPGRGSLAQFIVVITILLPDTKSFNESWESSTYARKLLFRWPEGALHRLHPSKGVRLTKLYTGYMALGYIARHTWLYSHWLFSHVYMAI